MIINIVVRAWRQLPRPITSPIGRAIGQDWFWLTPCSGSERADWSVRESCCCVMWEHVQPSWSTTDCWTNGEWDEELLEPRKSSRSLSLWACWNTIAKRTGIPGAGLRASCEAWENSLVISTWRYMSHLVSVLYTIFLIKNWSKSVFFNWIYRISILKLFQKRIFFGEYLYRKTLTLFKFYEKCF